MHPELFAEFIEINKGLIEKRLAELAPDDDLRPFYAILPREGIIRVIYPEPTLVNTVAGKNLIASMMAQTANAFNGTRGLWVVTSLLKKARSDEPRPDSLQHDPGAEEVITMTDYEPDTTTMHLGYLDRSADQPPRVREWRCLSPDATPIEDRFGSRLQPVLRANRARSNS